MSKNYKKCQGCGDIISKSRKKCPICAKYQYDHIKDIAQTDRNRWIVELVDEGIPQAKIARDLGLTRQRIHQIYESQS